MHRFGYGVLAGCLLSLFLPLLPAFFTIIFALLVILSAYCRRWLLLGLCSFLASWHWQLDRYMQAQQMLLASTNSYIAVEVLHVEPTLDGVAVQLKLLAAHYSGYKVRVHWQQPPPVQPGERWQLVLNLKPPAGNLNPWTPHPRLQALIQQQLAQGHVSRSDPAIKLRASQSQRQRLLLRLEQQYAALDRAVLLRALITGEREFDAALWQGLRNSGLGHLLVISGLHISLVYGWSYLLLTMLQRWFRGKAVTSIAMCLAFLPALGYAWLAGFAIPTLRAALALLLFMLGRILWRPANPVAYWWLLVSSLLLIQPFWLLSYSFWLSALAVGLILLVVRYLGAAEAGFWPRIRYFLYFQLLLSTLMTLITLAFFSGFSPLALLSNLLFVPWCTLLVIPLLLFTLGYFLLGLPNAHWLWQACDLLLSPLLYWLQFATEHSWWWSQPALPLAAALLLMLACATLLLLRASKAWWGLFLATVSLALLPAGTEHPTLTLLDAGQRTVLLLRQPTTNLLYLDLPAEHSEAVIQQFVLPLLSYYHLAQLDTVVIPGWQRDMQLAVAPLLARYPKARLYAANPAPGVNSCQQLSRGYADWVQHWPLPEQDPCVLSFRLNGWTLLLPGNLTVGSEQQLVLRYPELNADLYLLANFGRDSANSLEFLQQLAPVQLLLAASSSGAYPYPVQAVRPRLSLLNLPLYHSGNEGALQLVLEPEQLLLQTERQRRWPRWTEKPTR